MTSHELMTIIILSKFQEKGEPFLDATVQLNGRTLQDEYVITEGETKSVAKWIDIEDIKNGKKIVYPEVVERYI